MIDNIVEKPGCWRDWSVGDLLINLINQVDKLRYHTSFTGATGLSEDKRKEWAKNGCINIANYAMMIHDKITLENN